MPCVSEGSHKNYKLYLLFNKVSANTIFTSIKQESITIKARLPQLLILAYPFLLLLILHYFSYFIVLTFNSLKSLELFLQAFILAAILHLLMQVFGLNLLAHVSCLLRPMLLATKISFQFLTFHIYISTHLQVMLLDTVIDMDLKLYILSWA